MPVMNLDYTDFKKVYSIDDICFFNKKRNWPGSIDLYTKSLIHFNGTISDEYGRPWTASGGAGISSAQSKFGTHSCYFDGVDDYLSTPDSSDFDLGLSGQPYTLDFWVYPTSTDITQFYYHKGGSCDGGDWNATNGLQLIVYKNNTTLDCSFWNGSGEATARHNSVPTPNTFNHIELAYDGTTTRVALNGVFGSTTTTSGYYKPNIADVINIGRRGKGSGYYKGYMSEFHVTKGMVLHTNDFTPPIAPYTP